MIEVYDFTYIWASQKSVTLLIITPQPDINKKKMIERSVTKARSRQWALIWRQWALIWMFDWTRSYNLIINSFMKNVLIIWKPGLASIWQGPPLWKSWSVTREKKKQSRFAIFLKLHFCMGVLLWICCTFPQQCF